MARSDPALGEYPAPDRGVGDSLDPDNQGGGSHIGLVTSHGGLNRRIGGSHDLGKLDIDFVLFPEEVL